MSIPSHSHSAALTSHSAALTSHSAALTTEAPGRLIAPAARPEVILAEIRRLITDHLERAKKLAAEAVARFPDHGKIRSAHRVINGPQGPVGKAPAEAPTDQEFEWLRNAPEPLRGHWVAISGSELLVADLDIHTVMKRLRTEHAGQRALLHYLE